MLTPNTVIQNYRLVRKLGEGGMGEVWLAEHLTIARKVAIKVLHAQYARNPKIQQRFRNEAATLSKLKHPNIVALYDFIESDSDIYLVMEYVEGRNLEEVVRTDTGPMPTAKLLQIFKQILSAVGYAHQQGVVHRDIKPSNFMIGDDGVVKVLDFGIAKLLEDDQHLTKTGLRMGTTFYMSPEQVNTEAVDHRSDIYSLGVTLFFLATGKAPYEGETSEYKVFDQIVRTPLPAGRTVYVGVAPEVDAVIAKATKKAPTDRFQGCGEFLEGFEKPVKPVLPKEQLPSASNPYPNWKRISAMVFLLAFILIAVVLVSKNVKGTEPNNASIAREKAIADSLNKERFIRKSNRYVAGIQEAGEMFLYWSEKEQANFKDSLLSIPDTAFYFIMSMIPVKGGTFSMGCTQEQRKDCEANELPPHNVTLSDFSISMTEVTQTQWKEVMGDNPSSHKQCADCPVENVSWNRVQVFLKKLNQKTGKRYRLPTEAEWEYAARGGGYSKGTIFSGSNDIGEVAWYGENSGTESYEVGGKKQNEVGLRDMSGNVSEWCQDWYGKDYYNGLLTSQIANPKGPTGGMLRVIRGGSYLDKSRDVRFTNRDGMDLNDYLHFVGFRLASD